MKILPFLLFWITFSMASKAQSIYIDPAVSGATAAHAGIMNTQLNATKEKLTLIERGQLAVTGQLAIVNSMQDKIYKGLSQVSSVLSNLSDVKEIARITIGMTDDLNKGMEIARKNPVYLVFAEEQARFFKERATKLALEVSTFVLKGGADNLMDSGERSKLINNVLTEMLILRSLTYGMYRAMYYAQMRGLMRSLNPFQGYINMDMQIVDDIIRKRQYLK
jgi:hypothetical protein